MIISLAGQPIHLLKEGVIWLPSLELLAVADMHFEKATFFSRFGTLLPPYDSADTLERLEAVLHHYKPAYFLALGDSFHDVKAGERMQPPAIARLNALIEAMPNWIWITGNHDPSIDGRIGGKREAEAGFGGIIFRHQSRKDETRPEISGHFHPKLRFFLRGHYITGSCFVRHREKLVLPAFGSFTGGLNVRSLDFLRAFPEPAEYYLISQNEVFEVELE